jgi:8-hydroxy-5-deazaflavin:NADPH oxidoreductase
MRPPTQPPRRIALIGGTGPEGRGLALRLAAAGHQIVIGSRSQARATDAAADTMRKLGRGDVGGEPNLEAARGGDLVVLTIPYGGMDDALRPLENAVAGKIVVSAIAPIEFVQGRPVAYRPEAGSAGQRVQELLPDARVVSAFQTIDAHQLGALDAPLETDVIVCSDDAEARREIMALASQIPGIRALSGGRLAHSRYVEECTALLITMNRIYKAHSGLRLTGIDR